MWKSFMCGALFAAFANAMTVVIISKPIVKEMTSKEMRKTDYWKRECKKSQKALDDFMGRLSYLTLNEAAYLFDDADISRDEPFLGIISPLGIDPDRNHD